MDLRRSINKRLFIAGFEGLRRATRPQNIAHYITGPIKEFLTNGYIEVVALTQNLSVSRPPTQS